ncbi:MAG: type II secretion system protein E [Desulfobulbaceae bacterium]|mgnify:CR=1 FL=1|nr:MAG: type II secretion system protein E [Desulfobulbaceae bacterium]
MQLLNDEQYLLDLLFRHQLISSEQRKMISLKKELQRQNLMHKLRDRGIDKNEQRLDLVDVILSFNLEIPGRRGEFLSEEEIIRTVAQDRGLPFKKLDPLELDMEVVTKTIPQNFAMRHLLVPFEVRNGILEMAVYEPGELAILEDVMQAKQMRIRAHLATKSEISRILAEFFGFQSSISAAEDHLAGPSVDISNLEQLVKIGTAREISSSDKNIKAAVNHMFNYAFDERASDIHIEPKRAKSLVRFRIDGVLHTIYELPKVVHAAMVSRIKFLARLDIAEKRRPQDGRIKVQHHDQEAEIRVSTVPVSFGEKAVLRILNSEVLFQNIEDIGFNERDLAVYKSFVEAPHGIVLVTGPTGSGKSTTLYSTLHHVASPEINITTVEDPVEMVYEAFNQISVQSQIDVTFSTILRNILRQDPDIIMIGEIRDYETAAHAVQAALTGHLVFSTLHTNDAVTSITRLIELGVQPFLVSSTMLGAMAQRLVRTICSDCKEEVTMPISALQGFGFPLPDRPEMVLYQGKGCRKCRGTGYYGRCGVFEIFPMSDAIKAKVAGSAPASELQKVATAEGMTTLKEDAWDKVRRGITTFAEAVRVTGSV